MKPGYAEISVMIDGHVRRAHAINDLTLTGWLLCRLIGFDASERMFKRDTEGTTWVWGWDEEAQGALRAAYNLKDA